jgi:gas vesicle protein
MKLVVGFLSGLVIGAVGAVAYSVQSGRDLREAFEEVRSDLSKRDLDALGARLESRVTEMQAQLETRITQVRERAASVMDEATPVVTDAIDDAGDKAGSAVEGAAAVVEDAAADAGDKVAEAAQAAEDQAGA